MGEHVTVAITLRINLQAALHIGTGLGLAQILDDHTVQGPHPQAAGADLPYIPGSSLKGRLRFHTRRLAELLGESAEAEVRLFGTAQQPAGILFSDAYLADLPLARQMATQRGPNSLVPLLVRSERSFVALSRGRRVALDQRLFRIAIADAGLTFSASLRGALPQDTARRDLALLLVAARDLTHLGGHKGRGLGRCQIEPEALLLNGTALQAHELLEALR